MPLVTVTHFWDGHWEGRWPGPSAGPKCDVLRKGWWRMQSPHVLLLLSSALCCVHTSVGEADTWCSRMWCRAQSHQPTLLPPHQKCTILPSVSPSLGLWEARGTYCLSPSPSLFITGLRNMYGFPISAYRQTSWYYQTSDFGPVVLVSRLELIFLLSRRVKTFSSQLWFETKGPSVSDGVCRNGEQQLLGEENKHRVNVESCLSRMALLASSSLWSLDVFCT